MAIKLERAQLCPDCDVIYEDQACPCCGSENGFWLVSTMGTKPLDNGRLIALVSQCP